jgi:hypothetical protein
MSCSAASLPYAKVTALKGLFGKARKRVSIKEMNAAIAAMSCERSASAAGAHATMTFDRPATKHCGMTLGERLNLASFLALSRPDK